MMDRRLFLGGLAALTGCGDIGLGANKTVHRKQMAITLDDFNLGFDIGLSQAARHQNILEAFDAVGHKAAGFVTGQFVDSEWGQRVVQDWLDAGHMIANHTWSHPHADETDSSDYLANIRRNQDYLDKVDGTSAYFRFPFLDDGRDRDQQVELFQGLDKIGLRNAPVTIDTIDWFTSSRLETALRQNPNLDILPYKAYYIKKCVRLSNHWDDVARALGFVSLPHQFLIHHNILNGHFLKDVLRALKADGWTFINASEALAFQDFHPIPSEPTKGRNWLTLKSYELDIETPPYPEEYLAFGRKTMDALGL